VSPLSEQERKKMRSLRIVAPVALGAATLIALAATPSLISDHSSARSAEPIVSYEAPVAHASGTDLVTPLYPSIVNVRLERAEAALERAVTAVDSGQEAQAVTEILSVRTNMVKAWTAAKFVISQPPPPPEDPEEPAPPEEPVPGAYAAPADTAAAVLNLQHEVITTSLGLMDTAGAPLAESLRGTISGTLSARDAAVNYIHTIAPPPVEEGRVQSTASDAPVGGTYDIVMPLFVPQLDDEILQASGTAMSAASVPNFGAWVGTKATATKTLINTYWPPVVGED
jgi:hypothetical protein